MFSMAESKPHSIRKRMISNVYSKFYVQSSPELHEISQVVIYDRLLPLLDKAASEKKPLDVLELNYSIAMDFIMAFIFGLQNGTNFIEDVEARKHWLGVYQSRRPCMCIAGLLVPNLMLSVLEDTILKSHVSFALPVNPTGALSLTILFRSLLVRRTPWPSQLLQDPRPFHHPTKSSSSNIRNRKLDPRKMQSGSEITYQPSFRTVHPKNHLSRRLRPTIRRPPSLHP